MSTAMLNRLCVRAVVAVMLATWCPLAATAQTIEYYHLDALGSVRAVTDQSGAVIERHDYLPFGEEVSAPGGANPRQFTGKERDTETGLDYFGARYYSGKRARFTTVDPVITWQENLVDPQRWNRYAYVRNNPLRYTDPDGRILFDFQEFKANLTEALHFGQSGHGYLIPVVAGIATIGSVASDALLAAGGTLNVIRAVAKEAGNRAIKSKGIGGNPFKGKSPKEIEGMFDEKGFESRGPDPLGGKGGYVNPTTGRSYHIDPGGTYKRGTEPPHVDVNRVKGDLPKRKYEQ